jgi:hypothetical protein
MRPILRRSLLLMAAGVLAAACASSPAASVTSSNGGVSPAASDPTADSHTQWELQNAVAAEKPFFAQHDSYQGFDVSAARAILPSLTWADGGAASDPGVVHIHVLGPSGIVFDDMSASGAVFCVEEDVSSGRVYGRVDASVAGECSGGW